MPLAKFETAWALADPNNISKFQISFPSRTQLHSLPSLKTIKTLITVSPCSLIANQAMTSVHPPLAPGRELSNPPTDGISNLRFSNHSDHLLVSSWDKVLPHH